MDRHEIEACGAELFAALREKSTITPLTERYPTISIDHAYDISRIFLEKRLAQNSEKVVGKKIGVTSKPVQDMLDVRQPDFGFLTDAMFVHDGKVRISDLIQPRAEAEIAFVLKAPLKGPGVTPQMVIDATEYIAPCFEIVDSRISDWKIKIQDTVADNASCGVFVIGDAKCDPRDYDLSSLEVSVEKNGAPLSRGVGAAVQGAPENAVAWLANTLGAYGIPFEAGEIILSGSLVPLEPVVAGDEMIMRIPGVGDCAVSFV
ncbi:MAG: fumarylacetoacetate hydrolase family protein [Pseudomonadota bacterium]